MTQNVPNDFFKLDLDKLLGFRHVRNDAGEFDRVVKSLADIHNKIGEGPPAGRRSD